MKLDYRVEERWPEGVGLVEDEEGCSLNVGNLPGWVVVGVAGLLLGAAVLYGVVGGRAAWRQWRWGNGVDVGLMLGVGAAVLLFGGAGARMLRRHMRYGHLPGVYRLDVARGVFSRRSAGTTSWYEDEVGRIREARVREVRLLGGIVTVTVLTIRMDGERLGVAALFVRRESGVVDKFARRLTECAATHAVAGVDAAGDDARAGGPGGFTTLDARS